MIEKNYDFQVSTVQKLYKLVVFIFLKKSEHDRLEFNPRGNVLKWVLSID